jgi:hypothetical protein
MDHINRLVIIQNKYNLEESSPVSSTPHKPFVILHLPRIGMTGSSHHHFRFLGWNSMSADMFDIPVIPPEVHKLVMQENAQPVNGNEADISILLPQILLAQLQQCLGCHWADNRHANQPLKLRDRGRRCNTDVAKRFGGGGEIVRFLG